MSTAHLSPGQFVLHPTEDWGLGQIQSVDGNRVTCNFEHRGKVTIDASVIELEITDPRSTVS
ncbi:MAG: DUF3553 domain-containing protein [Rhodospirillales bacterium]